MPGPPSPTQVNELIQWYCDLAAHKDTFVDDLRFTGPGSVTYPARSAGDPVHRLEVETSVAAAYLELDMRLTAGRVGWSESAAAVTAGRAGPEGVPEPARVPTWRADMARGERGRSGCSDRAPRPGAGVCTCPLASDVGP